jgi:hypothetical protein
MIFIKYPVDFPIRKILMGKIKKIQDKNFATISESNQMYVGWNYIPSANFWYQSQIFIPSAR